MTMVGRCSRIIGFLALAPGLVACAGSLQEGQERNGLARWIWLLIILAIVALYWLLTRRRIDDLVDRSTRRAVPGSESESPPVEEAHGRMEERGVTLEVAEPSPTPGVPAVADDLKILEGIGPKVEQVLAGAGITTFAGLARTEVERLGEILRSAGLPFMDATTWPEQAALAAAGEWERLTALQGELSAGRRT